MASRLVQTSHSALAYALLVVSFHPSGDDSGLLSYHDQCQLQQQLDACPVVAKVTPSRNAASARAVLMASFPAANMAHHHPTPQLRDTREPYHYDVPSCGDLGAQVYVSERACNAWFMDQCTKGENCPPAQVSHILEHPNMCFASPGQHSCVCHIHSTAFQHGSG